MVQCDRCDEWYHYGCIGLKEDPPPDQKWYCGYCTYDSEKTKNGKRVSPAAVPETVSSAKRQLLAPKWRELVQKGYLQPGDSILFVKDISKYYLRHVHEGVILDNDGTIGACGEQTFPSLSAFCIAMGDKSKRAFNCSYTASFFPLDQLRHRCARSQDAPSEGPPPSVPSTLPSLPFLICGGALTLQGAMGHDRCFRMELKYNKKVVPDMLSEILGLIGEAIDKILDMNMFFMPEGRAGRRPLLYKIAIDPVLVRRLRKLVWEHAKKSEWVGPDSGRDATGETGQRTHVDVLFPQSDEQKVQGPEEAERLWKELLDAPLRDKSAQNRKYEDRAYVDQVVARMPKGLGEVPYHLVYMSGLSMSKDFLACRVPGVNQMLAYIGQQGNGQHAHLEDFVRGHSYRKPILHLAAVNLLVASEEPEAKVWYCADKDTIAGENVLGHMDIRQNGCPFFVQHRDARIGWELFESAIVQREGEMVIQPMWCIHQDINLCRSVSFSQNAYPYPAKFIPPAEPFFEPYSANCCCGHSSIIIDDGVFQMAASLGMGSASFRYAFKRT